MNTQTDTAELRRLHEAATKGEWRSFRYSVAPASLMVGDIVCQPPDDDCEQSLEKWPGNANFIAAAHNALPALLDELEAAREEVRRLESDNAKLAWAWNEVQSDTAQAALDKARLIQAAHVCLDSLVWLKIRDRRTKLIGAAEELELVAGEWSKRGRQRRFHAQELLDRAAQRRREAERNG